MSHYWLVSGDRGSKFGSTFAPKVEEKEEEIANALDPSLRWEDNQNQTHSGMDTCLPARNAIA